MIIKLQYRCRRCDYDEERNRDTMVPSDLNAQLQSELGTPPQLHKCPDGGRGVLELIGAYEP